MSVIVKDMEMPTSCDKCRFCVNGFTDDAPMYECAVQSEDIVSVLVESDGKPFDFRPDWCPLIDIPTPHGDLVDRNKLLRKAKRESTYAWKMNLHARTETILNQFIDWLDSAEVIIKAERETK